MIIINLYLVYCDSLYNSLKYHNHINLIGILWSLPERRKESLKFIEFKCQETIQLYLLFGCRDSSKLVFNTLRPRQDGCHFPGDIFKCIFLNENLWISIKISLKFVLKGPINNIPALVQIMAWRRQGDKPLSEPMMVSLPTHICVTRPQWVN